MKPKRSKLYPTSSIAVSRRTSTLRAIFAGFILFLALNETGNALEAVVHLRDASKPAVLDIALKDFDENEIKNDIHNGFHARIEYRIRVYRDLSVSPNYSGTSFSSRNIRPSPGAGTSSAEATRSATGTGIENTVLPGMIFLPTTFFN